MVINYICSLLNISEDSRTFELYLECRYNYATQSWLPPTILTFTADSAELRSTPRNILRRDWSVSMSTMTAQTLKYSPIYSELLYCRQQLCVDGRGGRGGGGGNYNNNNNNTNLYLVYEHHYSKFPLQVQEFDSKGFSDIVLWSLVSSGP